MIGKSSTSCYQLLQSPHPNLPGVVSAVEMMNGLCGISAHLGLCKRLVKKRGFPQKVDFLTTATVPGLQKGGLVPWWSWWISLCSPEIVAVYIMVKNMGKPSASGMTGSKSFKTLMGSMLCRSWSRVRMWIPRVRVAFFLRSLPVNRWYRCLTDGDNAWAMSCLEDVVRDAWWNPIFHMELQGSRNRYDRLNVMLQEHEKCMEKESDNEEKWKSKITRMTVHFLFNFQLLADKKARVVQYPCWLFLVTLIGCGLIPLYRCI